MDEREIKVRIEELSGRPPERPLRFHRDTTEFTEIQWGHVLVLEEVPFLVTGEMKEGRFGLDDQPKFWVKRVLDLVTGEEKVVKLVFLEEFHVRLGLLRVRCWRDPAKEAAVLDLVRGDERFMQGRTVRDQKGNLVRILDFVHGRNLYDHLRSLALSPERYLTEVLPGFLLSLLEAFEAIAHLHLHGLHHGDIRSDHLLLERGSSRLRWIDFDLDQAVPDYDLWSLGNVLLVAAGMGERTFKDVSSGRQATVPGEVLDQEDASAFFAHRIINLRKLFPMLPRAMNDILMHFSWGTERFYETVDELLDDLRAVTGPVVR